MNNSNHNKFYSTLGFNEMKIGRIFEIESFANDFNNRLKLAYENLQDLVKILLIIFIYF
jgi:hypothetical protein